MRPGRPPDYPLPAAHTVWEVVQPVFVPLPAPCVSAFFARAAQSYHARLLRRLVAAPEEQRRPGAKGCYIVKVSRGAGRRATAARTNFKNASASAASAGAALKRVRAE